MMALNLSEIDAQKYRDSRLSAGLVHDHAFASVYLKLESSGEEPTIILFPSHVAMRICALLANAVWSNTLYGKRHKKAEKGWE